MVEDKKNLTQVWVFSGNTGYFPSAVFTERHLAEAWILKNKVSGTLTAYPLNVAVYDYSIEHKWFKPEKEEQRQPGFIGNFSSASQEHYHYDEGENDDRK